MKLEDIQYPHDDLKPLLQQAVNNSDLLFYCSGQNLWLTPKELVAAWERDKFRWSAVNWELKSKADYGRELNKAVQDAQELVRAATQRAEESRVWASDILYAV